MYLDYFIYMFCWQDEIICTYTYVMIKVNALDNSVLNPLSGILLGSVMDSRRKDYLSVQRSFTELNSIL